MIVGYLNDVVGPVTMPLYTVTLYKEVVDKMKELELTKDKPQDFWIGKKV